MMAMMMGSLYQALRESGASDDNARKAAEEVADYQKQIADIRTDLAMLKAIGGVTVAGVVALVVKTFFV